MKKTFIELLPFCVSITLQLVTNIVDFADCFNTVSGIEVFEIDKMIFVFMMIGCVCGIFDVYKKIKIKIIEIIDKESHVNDDRHYIR